MKKLRITVDGKPYEVTVEVLDEGKASVTPSKPKSIIPLSATVEAPVNPVVSRPKITGAIVSPIAGKVVSIDVSVGQNIEAGATMITLEAMKMNTFVSAPAKGTVTDIHVMVGDGVEEGQSLLSLT